MAQVPGRQVTGGSAGSRSEVITARLAGTITPRNSLGALLAHFTFDLPLEVRVAAPAPSVEEDPLWRMRWLLLASGITVLAAVSTVVGLNRSGWNWALFGWGVAIGVVGLAVITGAFRVGLRRDDDTDDQRERLRRRILIYSVMWPIIGIICGAVSAAFDQAWLDIGVAAYVALAFGVGFALVWRQKERTR